MRTTLKCLLAVAFTFSFASCKKEIPTKVTGYFYTSVVQTNEESLLLFMDGELKGNLPYADIDYNKVAAIDSSIKRKTLRVEYMSGNHSIEARKADGTLISSAIITNEFYRNEYKSGVRGGFGGANCSSFNDRYNEQLISLFQ